MEMQWVIPWRCSPRDSRTRETVKEGGEIPTHTHTHTRARAHARVHTRAYTHTHTNQRLSCPQSQNYLGALWVILRWLILFVSFSYFSDQTSYLFSFLLSLLFFPSFFLILWNQAYSLLSVCISVPFLLSWIRLFSFFLNGRELI